MKIKDLERCVNVAWSPQNQCPIYLATGTAAQQLDASFSTNASLELYTLNLSEPGMDMELKASTPSDNRFYKVVWGAHGPSPSGVIVGGCDGGMVHIYDSGKLLAGEEGLISRQDKHNGPVQALDFNPFQSNLLASGAADSEIYIWDLNNTSTPMTPGAKSQPFETVQCVSWNRQVQHILATTFSTRCVVWDLRKNEPIIKLSDSASHIRWKSVCWHPEVATQLCLASEEDQAPVIQLWDLRFATSPLKVLDQHQRGVLSLAWCVQDPELLISCGKDNRILCWNPNSSQAHGEVLSQVAQTLQWNFDVAWCPRNPALIAASSFDGHVSVYSLMGGQQQQVQTSDKIADSFPGMDGYVQAPCPQQAPPVSVDLTKPPKWLKRPVGASFAFGGKLISFVNDKSAEHTIRSVHISQVITEPELINKAKDLEEALQLGNFAEYCHRKADVSESQHERYVWHFLKAMFAKSPKTELLQLLGFHTDDIAHVILNKRTQSLNLSEQKALDDNTIFDSLSEDKSNLDKYIPSRKLSVPYKIKTGNDIDGLIAQAILIGDIENAVELCIDHNRMADALIIAMTGGADLLARTQLRYLQQSDGYVSALISALVSEDWSSVVNQCTVDSWKEALAAALTYSSPEELPLLCERLGERLEAEAESSGDNKLLQNAQMCYICAGSFGKLVASWSADLSASHTPQKIQDLVELVTFLQKAIEQQQGRSVEISGGLANLLSRYAILLASQGNLNSALSYLGNSATDARVNELRERLYCHLGHKPAYHQQPQVQQQYSAVRRVSAVQHYTNQFSTTPAIPTFTPGAAAPPKPFSPASPPVLQPPRPNSASGMRAKYILDPSMQSNAPVYNNTSIRNVPYAATAAPPSPGGYSSLSNKVGSVPAIGSFPPSLPPTNHFQPANIPNNNMNMQNNNVNNNLEVAQPALNLLNQVNATTMSQPGWNDPPVISRTPRPQLKTEMMAPPPPITHPLFGTSSDIQNNGYGEPPVPMPASMPVAGSMPYGQMPPQQSVPQMQQQLPPMNNFMQPQAISSMPPQSVGNMPPPVQQQQQQMPPGPPAVKPKGPVPEEHMYLQTVFNELQTQCSCAANNPQTKRKLEDVTRKLEALYDMLREHKLSAQTLSALHQMVQSIQIGDYTGGLGLHTQLVSGSDFAQIASFMPGIKVLLQCALQLQVFLR